MKLSVKIAFLLSFIFCFSAKAEDMRLENAILINADEIIYNDNIEVVNAFGNVEIAKGDFIVWADEITYNKAQDIIIAKGNITFKDKEGNITYGSSMEFDNNMQTGLIRSPQGRLIDDSRVAAALGERESETLTKLKNVVYSPCEICEGDNDPIWQIKAKEVTSDEESLDISYKHAWLELYGTPVFYTPFLTHPDPRVERRSGWLSPKIENSSDIGLMLRNYYYWDINENTDATIEVTAIDLISNPLIGGEVRHLTDNGKIFVSGSMTSGDSKDFNGEKTGSDTFQGHLFSTGRFDMDEHWRTGFDLYAVTDDNYFEIYDFDMKDRDTLTSKAYAEGFYGNDYFALTAYNFTDLRPNIPVNQPVIFPFAEYSLKGDKFLDENIRWTFQGDLMALDQDNEAKEVRLYNQSGLERNYLSTFGMSLDLGADLYTRAYIVDHDADDKDSSIFEMMPQLYMLAKYPLRKNLSNGGTAIIEPVANLIIAPNGANNEDISLQDSTVLGLDYTNLFSKNRLSGVDRLQDGIRGSYGLKTSTLNKSGGYSSLFLGQTYRHRENDYLFDESSGLNDKFSDIIVELQLKPNKYMNLDYYSLLDKDNLTDKKHEAYFSFGPEKFRLMGSYLYSKEGTVSATGENLHELKAGFSSKMSEYWRLSGKSTSSLGAGGDGLLKAALNLEYIDECFSFGLSGERDLTNRKGAQSATTIMFRLGLKNLISFESPSLSTDMLTNDYSE